jgi:hypothetical protein
LLLEVLSRCVVSQYRTALILDDSRYTTVPDIPFGIVSHQLLQRCIPASIILLRLFTSGSPTAIPVCAIAKVCKFALTKCTETPGFACFLEVLLGLRGHGCRPFTGRTRALFQYGLLHFGLAHTLGVGLFSPDIQMYPHRLHVFVILILVPPI